MTRLNIPLFVALAASLLSAIDARDQLPHQRMIRKRGPAPLAHLEARAPAFVVPRWPGLVERQDTVPSQSASGSASASRSVASSSSSSSSAQTSSTASQSSSAVVTPSSSSSSVASTSVSFSCWWVDTASDDNWDAPLLSLERFFELPRWSFG